MSKVIDAMNSGEIDYSRNYAKKYNANPVNIARRLNLTRVREYGIGSHAYDMLFAQQGGKCAICDRHQSEFKRGLSIDHDHKTGKVRGLLCTRCNAHVVYLLDTAPQLLDAARAYLASNA